VRYILYAQLKFETLGRPWVLNRFTGNTYLASGSFDNTVAHFRR